MKRNRQIVVSMLSLLFTLAIAVVAVLAWIEEKLPPAVGEVHIGEISYSMTYSNPEFIDMDIDNLMYVDWKEDIILDRSGHLSDIATSVMVRITIAMDSQPVKVILDLPNTTALNGLFVLVIIEGINLVDTENMTSSYHSLTSSLVWDDQTTREDFLDLFDGYNQAQVLALSNIILQPGDELTLQLVFWGDYEGLSDPSSFLTTDLEFQFKLEITQPEKEVTLE